MRLFYIFLLSFLSFSSFAQSQTKPTPEVIKKQMQKEGAVLVDVRTPEEFAAGHVTKSKNSDLRGGTFAQEFSQWDKSKTYYLYCASGNRSGQAQKLMQEAGFTNVVNLGAFKDLQAAGFPVKSKPAPKNEKQ